MRKPVPLPEGGNPEAPPRLPHRPFSRFEQQKVSESLRGSALCDPPSLLLREVFLCSPAPAGPEEAERAEFIRCDRLCPVPVPLDTSPLSHSSRAGVYSCR